MAEKTGLLDLPVDILHLIFPYLDAKSFLHLTSTCTALHKPIFLDDSTFWSQLVRHTFRVPNQPVVQQDGQRWQRLFKRLLTQSRIYTWGNNDKSCLGHSQDSQQAMRSVGPQGVRRVNTLRRRHVSWPEQMQRTQGLGVISDLQCGGWSTTLLTAKGALYIVGVIDGLQMNQRNPPYMQRVMMEPVPLNYPTGYVPPYERYDQSTAIKQFSAGRAHVLALSDSGRIWSWQDIQFPAWHVRFPNIEVKEDGRSTGKGVVKKVVAGWNKSAALIEGTGIVVWDVIQRRDRNAHEDTALVLQSVTVPRTNESKPNKRASRLPEAEVSRGNDLIGEVQNFIVLEHYLVFCTSKGRVFAAQILWTRDQQDIGQPFELPLSRSGEEDESFAEDVQGSFRSFAVFTRSGNVLTSDELRIERVLQTQTTDDSQICTRIPALQRRQVIQLAFGDYHFHALHSPGYITSYGTEPQCCGALGLGGHGDGEGRLRGIRYQGVGGDGRLIPHAYAEGRRVWFEREKRSWIQFLTSGGHDHAEAIERIRMAIGSPDLRCQGEVSEWVEQEGRDWEIKFGVRSENGDEGNAYFALSVTAAGWHSGALVLVNDDMATKLKRAVEERDPAEPLPSSSRTADENKSEDNGTSSSEATASPSYLSSALNTTLDYGRWALGLPPYNQPYTIPDDFNHANNTTDRTGDRGHGMTPQMGDFQRGQHPINYGASPRVGMKYVWAEDHFPRLRLSDGTEMPGEVEFDEWRYERPVWDEEFSL